MNKNIATVKISFPKFGSVTRKEWDDMENHAIKKWHFEKNKDGYFPVSDEGNKK